VTQQDSVEFAQPALPAGSNSGGIGWKVALPAMLGGIVVLIWAHWDTAFAMYHLWSSIHSYNHAFLILPVCLYLVWERRGALQLLAPDSSWLGLFAMFAIGAFWMVADAVDVMAARQAALIGMIEGVILATLGWRVCKAILFPLLYAWLVLPFDLGLLPPLQTMATAASVWGIGLLDIPIFVEGYFIELPSGRYWIAPGCAGLNFLLSGFALSLLYGEQMYDGWRKRTACVVVMIVVAIVANWIRIFALIGAGHFFDQIYDINDHYLEGWLFFAVIVFVMMWIGMRFRDPVRQEQEAAPNIAREPLRAMALAAYLAVAAGGVAGGLVYPAFAAYQSANSPSVEAVHIEFPMAIGDWRRDDPDPGWWLKFKGADAQGTVRYTRNRASVDLFVAYYQRQGNGREVLAFKNRVYDNKLWHLQRRGGARVRIGQALTDVTETTLRSKGPRRLVWHVYWVDGEFVRSTVKAKLLQAKANLLFGDRRAGFIAASSQDEDKAALKSFLQTIPPIADFVAPGAAGG